jgi:hypothetical protein
MTAGVSGSRRPVAPLTRVRQLGEDLLLELGSGRALEHNFEPDGVSGIAGRWKQPRRIGIRQVGQRQHQFGMLEKTVRHLVERQANVLEADLFAGAVEWNPFEALVHRAQHS